MGIPTKKYLTLIGLAGVVSLIAGIVLLTFSLIRSERVSRIEDGISTTAKVISIREDKCSRGRWSSKCYDIAVLFTDNGGNMVTTILEKEYDRPLTEHIPIVYNRNRPETAELDIASGRSWVPPGRLVSSALVFGGVAAYGYALLCMRLLRSRHDGKTG